jgi:hypothetical protein
MTHRQFRRFPLKDVEEYAAMTVAAFRLITKQRHTARTDENLELVGDGWRGPKVPAIKLQAR